MLGKAGDAPSLLESEDDLPVSDRRAAWRCDLATEVRTRRRARSLNLDHTLFSTCNRDYCWRDAVTGAVLRGEWTELELEAQQAVACEQRAEQRGDPIARPALQEAADQFRYEADLVTAVDLRAWLDRWELSSAQWLRQLWRRLLLDLWEDEPTAAEVPASVGPVEHEIMVAVGACSGRLDTFRDALAARAAVLIDHGTDASASEAMARDQALHIPEHTPIGLSRSSLREALPHHAMLEASFRAFRDRLASAEAVRAMIERHHVDWLRFACTALSLSEQSAAREAALCLRQDGMTLAEVADAARSEVESWEFYLEDVESPARDPLLGARPGDLVGPIPLEGGFTLLQVDEKELPGADDPEVLERACAALLEPHIQEAIDTHVEWHDATG
jgi:hypothetical protein